MGLLTFINSDVTNQHNLSIMLVVQLCHDSEVLAEAMAESSNVREDYWFASNIEGRVKEINTFLDTQEAFWRQRDFDKTPPALLQRRRIPGRFGNTLGANYSETIFPSAIVSIAGAYDFGNYINETES